MEAMYEWMMLHGRRHVFRRLAGKGIRGISATSVLSFDAHSPRAFVVLFPHRRSLLPGVVSSTTISMFVLWCAVMRTWSIGPSAERPSLGGPPAHLSGDSRVPSPAADRPGESSPLSSNGFIASPSLELVVPSLSGTLAPPTLWGEATCPRPPRGRAIIRGARSSGLPGTVTRWPSALFRLCACAALMQTRCAAPSTLAWLAACGVTCSRNPRQSLCLPRLL